MNRKCRIEPLESRTLMSIATGLPDGMAQITNRIATLPHDMSDAVAAFRPAIPLPLPAGMHVNVADPVTPTHIKATLTQAFLRNVTVKLDWIENTPGKSTCFIIERAENPEIWTRIGTSYINTFSSNVSSTGNIYYFRVRSVNAAGEISEPSFMVGASVFLYKTKRINVFFSL